MVNSGSADPWALRFSNIMSPHDRPSAELQAEVFPGVRLTREVGEYGTLLAIDRARKVLGFEPGHSWRDDMTGEAGQSR